MEGKMKKKSFVPYKIIIAIVLTCAFLFNPLYGQTLSAQLTPLIFAASGDDHSGVILLSILFGVPLLIYIIKQINKASTPITIESFVCNYWSDKNEDGIMNKDEFIGIKNNYRVGDDDKIMFVCRFINSRKGAKYRIKIYTPAGNLWKNAEGTLKDVSVHTIYDESTIRKLYDGGGSGQWSVKWFLNSECKSIDNFYINAPETPDYEKVVNPTWQTPKILSYQNINKICLYASTNALYNKLMEPLVSDGPWQVVTRIELDKVMQEQDLQFGNRFDQATAVRIGKLLGADAMFIAERTGDYQGLLKILDVENGTYIEFKNISTSRYRSNNDEWLAYSIIPYLLKSRVTETDKNGDMYSLEWGTSIKK